MLWIVKRIICYVMCVKKKKTEQIEISNGTFEVKNLYYKSTKKQKCSKKPVLKGS